MKRARFAIVALALLLGCGASPKEIERWEKDSDGPEKLAAVVRNTRAKIDTRRDAALALTRLVHKNRRVGLDLLTSTLAKTEEADRAQVIDALAPALVKDTRLPRPAEQLEQAPNAEDPSEEVGSEVAPDGDSSFAAKDAVHALLARDLVSSAPRKEELRAALLAWVEASTVYRMRDLRQRYSVEQSMRLLGAPAVKKLLQSFHLLAADVVHLTALIDELGDAETKQDSARALVALAHSISSEAWLARQRPIVEETNRLRKVNADSWQVDAQLAKFRDIRLSSVLVALSILGGEKAIAELVLRASDPRATEQTSSIALVALKPRMRELDATQKERIFVVAEGADEKPDPNTPIGSKTTTYLVSKKRNLAFACIAMLETSPELITRLYAMFSQGVGPRMAAVQAAIARIEKAEIDTLLDRLLASTQARRLNPDEALLYGPAIAKRFGKDVLRPYVDRREPTLRLTAIAAFTDDKELLASLTKDATPIPACDALAEDCERWCGVGLARAKPTTVGDFARDCVGKRPRPERDERVAPDFARLERLAESLVKAPAK